MTTNRTALGDQLTAKFDAQSFGARGEAGYRFSVASDGAFGITPYGAAQALAFRTPTYSETDLTAGGFGLTYAGQTALDTRSELGARFDQILGSGGVPLILRARLAWAHDWFTNPNLTAAFLALPGTSFVVNGAARPPNSALASGAAELHFSPNWSLLAKFDGEFANHAQTYAGTGMLRYTW
jgi:outer membrane autotransporter protein